MKKSILFLFVLGVLCVQVDAQTFRDKAKNRVNSDAPRALPFTEPINSADVLNILVPNPPVINVVDITMNTGFGTGLFTEGANDPISMQEGIVISSGGNPCEFAFELEDTLGIPGDIDMAILQGVPSDDAANVKINFVPLTTEIQFNAAFLTGEFAPFNDAGAVFISGPGYGSRSLLYYYDTNSPGRVDANCPNNGQALVAGSDSLGWNRYAGAYPDTNIVVPGLQMGSNYLMEFYVSDGNDDAVASALVVGPITSALAPVAPPIPTMGQWALVLFGLTVLTLGVVFVYNRQNIGSKYRA